MHFGQDVLPVQAIHDGVTVPSAHRKTPGWEAFLKGVGLVLGEVPKPKKKSAKAAGIHGTFLHLAIPVCHVLHTKSSNFVDLAGNSGRSIDVICEKRCDGRNFMGVL